MTDNGEEVVAEGVSVMNPNPYSRENEDLWFNKNTARNRYFCVRCRRGQHSKGYDDPCNTDCECLCKTHYIARDGFTKIPYGMPDNTKNRDLVDSTRLPRTKIDDLLDSYKARKSNSL